MTDFQMILQILGIPEQAEKDEIVKAAMEMKNSEIEDGYTADVIISRQVFELLIFLCYMLSLLEKLQKCQI